MNAIYYIGLDIHKKTIVYCIKRIDGTLVRQGTVCKNAGQIYFRDKRRPIGRLCFIPSLSLRNSS